MADTLLNIKYHEAKRVISDTQIDASRLIFPKNLKILSYDIGVILGNALDNAIEACVKLKDSAPEAKTFIRLYSLQKGNVFILGAENSFDGNLRLRGEGALPMTDKKDKNAHGMGLLNIKSTAEKYGGTMDFQVRDKAFVLSYPVTSSIYFLFLHTVEPSHFIVPLSQYSTLVFEGVPPEQILQTSSSFTVLYSFFNSLFS